MNKNIGKRVHELRIRRNLTQEELAEKVDSLPSYISNIERKNKCPSLTLLGRMVKELDTTYDYLLMDDFEIGKQLEIKYKDLFREVSKLTENTQKEFFNVTEELIKSLKNIEKK